MDLSRSTQRWAGVVQLAAAAFALATSAAVAAEQKQGVPVGIGGDSRGLAVAANRVYLADAGGLVVLDTTDPKYPTLLGRGICAGNTWGVAASGNTVYVADEAGLAVMDVTDPAYPDLRHHTATRWKTRDLVLFERTVYLMEPSRGSSGTEPGGICSVTFGVGALPWYREGPSTMGNAQGLGQFGPYLCVADRTYGLRVAAIGTMPPSGWTGSLPLRDVTSNVELVGKNAFLVGSYGLRVADISDPTAPVLRGSCALQGTYRKVIVWKDLALVGGESLAIVNVADPSWPVYFTTVGSFRSCWDMAVVEGLLYVADGEAGLKIVEIAQPIVVAALQGGIDTGRLRSDLQDFNTDNVIDAGDVVRAGR